MVAAHDFARERLGVDARIGSAVVGFEDGVLLGKRRGGEGRDEEEMTDHESTVAFSLREKCRVGVKALADHWGGWDKAGTSGLRRFTDRLKA